MFFRFKNTNSVTASPQTADEFFSELTNKWNTAIVPYFKSIQKQIDIYKCAQHQPLFSDTEPLINSITSYYKAIIEIINRVEMKLADGFFNKNEIGRARQYLGDTKMALINDAHQLSQQTKSFEVASPLPHYLHTRHNEFCMRYTEQYMEEDSENHVPVSNFGAYY